MEPRVLFISGKGGVGKTTLASALALRHATSGGRALVVSTDPAHNLGHLWHRRLGEEITELAPGVRGLELSASSLARAHLERAGRAMRSYLDESFSRRIDDYLDIVANAPGTNESALLEEIASLVANRRDELLIFDTAPTGHTRALMDMPRTMGRYTDLLLGSTDTADRFSRAAQGLGAEPRSRTELRQALGQRRERLTALTSALQGGEAAFILALTAERMPVLETIEFAADLADLGIRVTHLIANRLDTSGEGQGRQRELLSQLERSTGLPLIGVPTLGEEASNPAALAKLATLLDRAGMPPLGG